MGWVDSQRRNKRNYRNLLSLHTGFILAFSPEHTLKLPNYCISSSFIQVALVKHAHIVYVK